jgi:hypothetical protein
VGNWTASSIDGVGVQLFPSLATGTPQGFLVASHRLHWIAGAIGLEVLDSRCCGRRSRGGRRKPGVGLHRPVSGQRLALRLFCRTDSGTKITRIITIHKSV